MITNKIQFPFITMDEFIVFFNNSNIKDKDKYKKLLIENDYQSFSVFDEDVINPITSDQLIKWISSLESGNYIHGKGKLEVSHRIGDYIFTHNCCLGVLSKETKQFHYVNDSNKLIFNPDSFNDDLSVLSGSEAVLSSYFDDVKTYYYMSFKMQNVLAVINDFEYTKDYSVIIKILSYLVLPKVLEYENSIKDFK